MPVLLALLVLAGGCAGPEYSFSYRLTFEFDDNGRRVVASSVRRVHARRTTFPRDAVSEGSFGEAQLVELNGRPLVVTLMQWANPAGGPFGCSGPSPPGETNACFPQGTWTPSRLILQGLGIYNQAWVDGVNPGLGILSATATSPPVEIPYDRMPVLVTFDGAPALQTIQPVRSDDLAPQFGSGVRLVRATVQVTRDPVTRGIEESLPFLKAIDGDVEACSRANSNAALRACPGKTYFKSRGA